MFSDTSRLLAATLPVAALISGCFDHDDAKYRDAGVDAGRPDGELEWAVRAGGNKEDEGSGIGVLTEGGGIVLGGTFMGTAVFGPGEDGETELTSHTDYEPDIFVSRHAPDGSLQWVKRAGGSVDDEVGYVLRVIAQ